MQHLIICKAREWKGCGKQLICMLNVLTQQSDVEIPCYLCLYNTFYNDHMENTFLQLLYKSNQIKCVFDCLWKNKVDQLKMFQRPLFNCDRIDETFCSSGHVKVIGLIPKKTGAGKMCTFTSFYLKYFTSYSM